MTGITKLHLVHMQKALGLHVATLSAAICRFAQPNMQIVFVLLDRKEFCTDITEH